ncbi:MAG TPA: hypothetical protein VNA68_00200 [Candidatus Dormibacteraeota bacterium]|nr:hypothetical protein [Candidatus Dormibacteraeota bacterium]
MNDLFPSIFKGADLSSNSIAVIPIIFANIIEIILILSGVLAVIMIIWAGINYVISQGDPGRIKSAKDTITYAIFGLVLSAGAFLIIEFILGRFR